MFGAIDASVLMSLYEMHLMSQSCAFDEERRAGWNRYDTPHMIETIKWLRRESNEAELSCKGSENESALENAGREVKEDF